MHLGNALKWHVLKFLVPAVAPRSFARVSMLSTVVGFLYQQTMKKKSSPSASANLPVSKQTAGGVAGAIVGSVIAGPVGAVAGAIAGTIMGNRAAQGKTLVSSGTVKTAQTAAKAVKARLPKSKAKAKSSGTAGKSKKPTKATAKIPAPKTKASAKAKPAKSKASAAKRRK